MPIYDFEPPNEDLNYPDSFALLFNVRFPNAVSSGNYAGLPINTDVFWTASEGDIVRPEVWDGELLSSMLLCNDAVNQELGNLSRDGWPSVGLNRLRSAILKVCNELPEAMIRKENREAEEFFARDMEYEGQFRGFESVDEWIDGKRFDLTPGQRIKIRGSLDRAAPLILTWCCCTFHYCREMWKGQDIQPLRINEEPLENVPTLPKKNGKVVVSAKAKRAALLASMTPEGRRDFLRREVNAKLIQKLHRQGKIDDQTIFDIENI